MNGRLSQPYHVHVTANGRRRLVSVREHLDVTPQQDPALPPILLTFHPGYASGSYEDRDYFELLPPLLFDRCRGCCRLRVFTINHPGYDLPEGHKVDRFNLDPYDIDEQPALIEQMLAWLVQREFGAELRLNLLAYGHSMGGLALARADLAALQTAVAAQGHDLRVQKVLSAPALVLHEQARHNLGRLSALDVVKRTAGRLPLYDLLAQNLFRAIAPLLWRLDAAHYSLNPRDTFLDFPRYNPYVLLEQGRQLLRLEFDDAELVRLLGGTHLILPLQDGMVDAQRLARICWGNTAVTVHPVDSSHNAEREDPELVVAELCRILPELTGG